MDDKPKAPVADEQPLEATDTEPGAEDSASDSTAVPDLTALEALKQGAETWNQWRSDNPDVSSPDLSASDLADLDLGTVTEQVIQFTDTCGKIL